MVLADIPGAGEHLVNYPERHSNIKMDLDVRQVDVAFVMKPHNITYFAGYAPVCAGVLFFRHGEPLFCTLWLDAPEAKRFCRIPHILTYRFPRERLTTKMIDTIRKRAPRPGRIGVEKDFMLLRDYDAIRAGFPDAEFVDITPHIDRLRAVKSPEEIEHIRRSAAISDKAMKAALKAVAPGVTELDVAAEAEYMMKRSGSERPAFSTFVASGKRSLLAHPIASRRKIQEGEAVVIDLGATWEGYASDICRTTFAGEPGPEQLTYLKTIVRAQEAGANALRNGAACGEIYDAVYGVLMEADLGKSLPDDIGYGVGLRQSEFYPVIEKGSPTILKENMVVALLQTTSFSTKIGGLRVEDTYHIGEGGAEKLTKHVQPLVF
jgi:Xaa-Pro dipeptidase